MDQFSWRQGDRATPLEMETAFVSLFLLLKSCQLTFLGARESKWARGRPEFNGALETSQIISSLRFGDAVKEE